MCVFYSAIVTSKGEILSDPEHSDSHEDLISHFKLREGITAQNFVRVEFTPAGNAFDDPGRYVLRVDESETPAWFDGDMRHKVELYLRGRIERMIVNDERDILLGGCWILGKTAKVSRAVQCRIVHVREKYHDAPIRQLTIAAALIVAEI